jgi:type IV pilus assembly protein PilA
MQIRSSDGFSLIELLIVVAIIGIIAAIAVPNLLASRRSANQASTIKLLRNVHSAEVVYEESIGAGNFSNNLLLLGGGSNSTEVGVIDSTVVAATTTPKNGYLLTNLGTIPKTGTLAAQYSVQSTPNAQNGIGRTGDDSYFLDESGVIRHSTRSDVPANITSSPLGN